MVPLSCIYGEWSNTTNYNDYGTHRSVGTYGPYQNSFSKTTKKLQNWKEVIASGGNATNDYTIYSTESSMTDADVLIWIEDRNRPRPNRNFYCKTNGNYYHLPTAGEIAAARDFTISGLSADNHANIAIRDAACAVVEKFNGAVFIGTIHEAFETIRHPGEALLNGFKNFEFTMANIVRRESKRGRLGKSASELHALIGSTWLEAQFGWAPLISDIEKGAEALADMMVSTSGIVRVSGFGKEDIFSSSLDYYGTTGVGGIALNYQQAMLESRKDTTEYVETRYYGGVETVSNYASPDFGLGTLGLTMSNFAPTLWELTPWSFVVDYFTNVGDLINSWSRPEPVFTYLGKSTKVVKTVKKYGRVHPGIQSTGGGLSGSSTVTGTYFNRKKLSSLPLVIPELKMPPVNSKKWINLIALGRFNEKLYIRDVTNIVNRRLPDIRARHR